MMWRHSRQKEFVQAVEDPELCRPRRFCRAKRGMPHQSESIPFPPREIPKARGRVGLPKSWLSPKPRTAQSTHRPPSVSGRPHTKATRRFWWYRAYIHYSCHAVCLQLQTPPIHRKHRARSTHRRIKPVCFSLDFHPVFPKIPTQNAKIYIYK